jgi:hypothetical protein
MIFDVVIPFGPDDVSIIEKTLEQNLKHIQNYRKVFLISFDPSLKLNIPDFVHVIDEKDYPFQKSDVRKYSKNPIPEGRDGWYLQQLLKLYVSFVVPDVADNYLIIDADTFFTRPIEFWNEQGQFYVNQEKEYHLPYFDHMKLLHPEFVRVDKNLSGVSHHLMYNRQFLQEMMKMVEDLHEGKKFWEVYLENIQLHHTSGSAENELYFNYVMKYHRDALVIRKLKRWNNCSSFPRNFRNYDSISIHWYERK